MALQTLTRAVPLLERGGVDEKDELANALNMMGICYYYMHQPVRAQPYLLKAYNLDKQLCGADSAACAGVLTNLARVSEMQRKFEKAENYYRESLAVSYKIYEANDKKLVPRLQNLSAFLRRRHKNVEAASLERRGRDILSGT
jgi:tetratricopeptide (TPR) repeat protein